MADDSRERTHTAFAIKREGKKLFRWLEIGTARYEEHSGVFHAFLDRLPVGGFNGYVYFSPRGIEPPEPEARRSDEPVGEGEE